MLLSDRCGLGLLESLPYDVFAVISKSLSPRDVCNLCLCCRSLFHLLNDSDKIWLSQCQMIGVVSCPHIIEWRKGVVSYKALCRFLFRVQPLIGIWVHQNPELGNVVYTMPGFVSIVGCRIIPQELGPLGIEEGPLLWAPVFEVIGDHHGSALFLLHGREKDDDFFYPGSVKSIERTCNVLLLEVEPKKRVTRGNLVPSRSVMHHSISDGKLSSAKICSLDSRDSRLQSVVKKNDPLVPFSRLFFGDRRKLLETVTSQIRQKVPNSAIGPLFPRLGDDHERFCKDMGLLSKRRSILLKMYKFGSGKMDWTAGSELPNDPTQLDLSEIGKSLDRASGFRSSLHGDDGRDQCTKRKTLGRYFKDSLKQILRKSSSINGNHPDVKNSSSSSEIKHAQLHEFLRSGDTIQLSLNASTMNLSSYRAWPNMHDSRFALYKLPMRVPTVGEDYAGLWGGTFGWPPGKPTEDKPGKALFFLLLSYEEYLGKRLLIATKILEGTHYVLHPNGSAMFIVNIEEPSEDLFPWDTDADSCPVTVEHAFIGEGIANGYGFRYPGSKPGSLFVIQDQLLAFIWTESKAILTLQRLNLQELLKRGEQVPALPPISNFTYLTKSYSNVFTGFTNVSYCLGSPRNNR